MLPIPIPVLYAAAIAAAILVSWGTVQTARLGGCKDSLAAAQQQVAVMGQQIRQQNAAVDELKVAADAKLAAAAKALQEARSATKAAVGESARLRAAASQAANPGKPEAPNQAACIPSLADQAAKTIREAL